MKLLEKIGNNVVRKTLLAAGLMAGLAFVGAGTASARPRVYVGIGGPVAVRGYYDPYYAPRPYWGPAYVAPGYGYGSYYHGRRHRYWDARFGCWRYR